MVAEIRARGQRHDRWISWVIIVLVVVALVLGWVVKSAAENRTTLFDAGGISLRYPAGWVRSTDVQLPILLQVSDNLVQPFRTTLTLQRRPLPPDATSPLAAIQQNLALERARAWTAYRVLQTEEPASVEGRTGMHVTFAYVEANRNPFLETMPVVMHGEDYLFAVGGDGYVVTVTAAEPNYAQAQKALHALVRYLPK